MTACFTRCSKSRQFDTIVFLHLAELLPLASVIRRIPSLGRVLTMMLLAATMALAHSSIHAAEEVEIVQAHLESAEDGYRLSATFSFDLNRELEDTITRGIPLYFTTEVEMTRPRRYWFDEKTLSASRTVRISYNVLTRQYRAAITGSLQRSFTTLDDALTMVRNPGRWVIAEKGELRTNATYNVGVRMRLDLAHLPKPFQINALNNSDWRLSSEWSYFTFRTEE